MRNAYYQLLNRPTEICILRLAEIYNSNGQQRLLLARRNAITVGKGSGRSENDPLTYWKHNLQINAKSLSLIKINRWPPPSLKNKQRKNNREEVTLPNFVWEEGAAVHRFKTLALFLFCFELFPCVFFSRYFLDFEWSTIIAKHFDQVKHQFVWPDTLAKRLIGEKSGHRKKDNFELFNFCWIEVVLIEVCLLWHKRKPPSCSTFQVKARL